MMKLRYIWIIGALLLYISCKKNDVPEGPENPGEQPKDDTFRITDITDTYPNLSDFSQHLKWGPYNLHDPSVNYTGDYYYCYSTDVAYGQPIMQSGIMVRRSKDLVEWVFLGWANNGMPQQAAQYIRANGGEPFDGVWAPYIMKYNNEYRLYYSLSSPTPKLSAIGLLKSSSPEGPWVESGLVVTSRENIVMTNAIDPSVVVTPGGEHWMYYGSAWEGIYILQLDPETGLAKNSGSKGERIAARGWTGNSVNGNIEGPEIIYNEELQKYYLFISYDWLETKYNVRVGRSDSPTGPFYDFNGNDMNEQQDNIPMILAPYAFQGHAGWQGTGHCSVFKNNGNYYMAHQGRPAVNKYYMVMHARKIFWTDDGWPVVSPERIANIEQSGITVEEIKGEWERIVLNYRVVPGYSAEQINPDIQHANTFTIGNNGSVDNDADNNWSFDNQTLTINWADGKSEKLIVSRGYDWENHRECLVCTGLNTEGTAVWGKK